MTINTKRSIGDDIFFVAYGEIRRGLIVTIDLTIQKSSPSYEAKYHAPFNILQEKYKVAQYKNSSAVEPDYGNTFDIKLHSMYNNIEEALQSIIDTYEEK